MSGYAKPLRCWVEAWKQKPTGWPKLSALGQQVAGLSVAVYGGKSDMDEVKRRIDRIERRLELNDPHH